MIMNTKWKSVVSHTLIHLFMLVSGLEYAIIFPTLWEYLRHLGAEESQTFWLGLAISAMTVTDIVCSLLAGRLADLFSCVRVMVVGLNCFQLAGACLYLTASSPLLLLISRLVSGCGKCISVIFLADICKSTERKARTPILLMFNIASQIGLLLGPALNLLLQHVFFRTEYLTVTKLNAPGLFMLVLWSLFSLLVLASYHDLVKLKNEEVLEEQLSCGYLPDTSRRASPVKEPNDVAPSGSTLPPADPVLYTCTGASLLQPYMRPPPCPSRNLSFNAEFYAKVDYVLDASRLRTCSESAVEKRRNLSSDLFDSPTNSRRRRGARVSDKYIREAELLMGTCSLDSTDRESTASSTDLTNDGECGSGRLEQGISWARYAAVLIREEIVVLIFLRFVAMFCQTSMEAVIPALMDIYFLYDDMANSYLYLAAGVELLLMFFLLSLASRCVSERSLVLAGSLLLLISLVWHTLTIPTFNKGDRSNAVYFGLGIFLELIAIPTVCDIGLALYSKLLPDEMQGFCQGVRRFISQIGILLGPVWGSCTLPYPLLLTAVPLAMAAIGFLMFLISFRKMVPAAMENMEESCEQQPLLA